AFSQETARAAYPHRVTVIGIGGFRQAIMLAKGFLKVGGTRGKPPLTPDIVVGARGPNGGIEAPGQQGDSAALSGRWLIRRPAHERNAQNRQRKSCHRPSAEHTRYLPCQPIILLSHC